MVFSIWPRISLTRPLNVSGLAFAFDDGGVVLVDGDLLGLAEIADLNVFQLDAEILSDGLATSEFRDVIQHGLAAIAEARRLDGGDLQRATQLVHDQSCQRFAFDILGDDQQRTCRSWRSARAAGEDPSSS